MSAIVAWLFWIFGALIGALVVIGTLLRRLKDAGLTPEGQDKADEPANERSDRG